MDKDLKGECAGAEELEGGAATGSRVCAVHWDEEFESRTESTEGGSAWGRAGVLGLAGPVVGRFGEPEGGRGGEGELEHAEG